MVMTAAILISLLVGLVFGFGLGRRQGVAAARRELMRAYRRGDDLTEFL